ncbi:MAG: hypothetical protein HYV90_01700 [Candidatus Woesebacteria bacterium]|nr:MAG: hypothetical protein HYV90_01700 [Candidatus Woesebacteria bacterium]
MPEQQEFGPDTFEVYTEKTLQKLSSFNFKDLTRYLNTDKIGSYSFNIPTDKAENEKLTDFVTTVLELSRLAGIKENGVARKDVEDVLEKVKKGDFLLLKSHASEEGAIVDVCLSLARDKKTPQGRIPLPFTGGNLGIWVNANKSISFTGNRRYDHAAIMLTSVSKKMNLKISD